MQWLKSTHSDNAIERVNSGLEDHCAVCLEAFQPKQELAVPGCFHTLHRRCWQEWAKKSPLCCKCKRRQTAQPTIVKHAEALATPTPSCARAGVFSLQTAGGRVKLPPVPEEWRIEFGTKISSIVHALNELRRRGSMAKSLVFSNFPHVVKTLKKAFARLAPDGELRQPWLRVRACMCV